MSKKRKESFDPPPKPSAGWVMTFADLMSLLMAFFVMLLSMAEVDKKKFEEMGVSMRIALGSPVNTPAHSADDIKLMKDTGKTGNSKQRMEQDAQLERIKKTQADAQKIRDVLKGQVDSVDIEVETHGQIIVVRLPDSGVFHSGEAELVHTFRPILANLRRTIKDIEGEVVVSGHADDIPIQTDKYRSNWELSAARAYSVIDDLLMNSEIPSNRVVLRGFGASRPLVPNINAENRAKNRRVEIMIDQRETKPSEDEGIDLSGVDIHKLVPNAVPRGLSSTMPTPQAPIIVPGLPNV